MSTIKPGQLGQFRGKIGALVVYKWRGVIVGRSLPRKSSKPGTEDQLDQRKKFGRVGKFLKLFSEQIAVGWASDKKKETPINEAVRHHLKEALTGTYPDYEIDLKQVVISRGRGKIDGGFRPVATAVAGASVDISWITCNSTSRITKPTDKLTVVFLDENLRPGCVRAIAYDYIAIRSDLSVRIDLPWDCLKHPVHVYMFFSSENGKLASKSEYLGIVNVQE